MNERAMTPEEEAVLNMELFKTDELFRARVVSVISELLTHDPNIQMLIESLVNRRVYAFRESLAGNLSAGVRNSF